MATTVLTPLPIFGIVLTGVAIVTITVLHFWHSRLERRRVGDIEFQNVTPHSFASDESGLRNKDIFRLSPARTAPEQPGKGRVWTAADVQRGPGSTRTPFEDMDLSDLSSLRDDGRGRYAYCMTGARGEGASKRDNPFATPPSSRASLRGGVPFRQLAYEAAFVRPGNSIRPSNSVYSVNSSNDASPNSSDIIHYGCDLADSPLGQPYAKHHGNTPNPPQGRSPLRYGVTLSTVSDNNGNSNSMNNSDALKIHDSAGASSNTLKPQSSDDKVQQQQQERGRKDSDAGRSSIGRSLSNLSKSSKRSSSKKRSLSPLEVHPWRMSYT